MSNLDAMNLQEESKALTRLLNLFDDGSFTQIERLLKSNQTDCEVVAGYGTINGSVVYAYSQNRNAQNGAMGAVQAAKIKRIYDLAVQNGAPIVAIFDSFGAHIDEGIAAMEAYGELIGAAANISGVVPQVALVLGSCIGSSAVLASQSDIVIMSKEAELYVTSGSILGDKENIIGTSFLAAQNGTASIVCDDDADALNKARDIISYLPSNNLSTPLFTEYATPTINKFDALDVLGVINSVFDANSFTQILSEFGNTSIVGFARLGGASVGVVATNTADSDGYVKKDGANKIARFVRLCDAYSIPIISIVDSIGFLADKESEIDGSVKTVSMLTHAFSEATTAKIAVITGNAISSAYIAFASKAAGNDFVFAWDTATISALAPMTAVQLLYKDRLAGGESREDLEKEYAQKESAINAAECGFIDDVIAPVDTAARLMSATSVLDSKRVSTLNKKHSNIQL